jgi:cysteinyl-tRNA synthetase
VLRIYNTLTRKKESFKPRFGKKVNMFVCGPTVYDFSHIGHGRTYIFFDVFAKVLRKFGYKVFYLQNITDIDDKIIERAAKSGKTFCDIAREYEKTYRADMKNLGVNAVDTYARAADFIPQIIRQVERLMKRGYAYRIEDGIYFNVAKFKHYGKLSGRTVQQAEDAVSRIDESIKKKNKGDFCLWKISIRKPEQSSIQKAHPKKKISFQMINSEPAWLSPWGWGRPGWHIEDTAITEYFFGPQYDVHGGGADLIFPHHECEIAQQEAASGKRPFVKYWMHAGYLTVRKEKMSKSLKNFVTIRDMLNRVPKEVFRLLVLSAHWRSPLDYTEGALKQAKNAHERLHSFKVKIDAALKQKQDVKNAAAEPASLEKTITAFYDNLGDDLNTPAAIAQVFNVVNLTNPALEKGALSGSTAKSIARFLKDADAILGIIGTGSKAAVPIAIRQMAGRREKLRKSMKWHAADELRRKIEKSGWLVEDTSTGPRIKRK